MCHGQQHSHRVTLSSLGAFLQQTTQSVEYKNQRFDSDTLRVNYPAQGSWQIWDQEHRCDSGVYSGGSSSWKDALTGTSVSHFCSAKVFGGE